MRSGGRAMEAYIFGRLVPQRELDGAEMASILDKAHRIKEEVVRIPESEIIDTLDRISELWRDKSYPYRREAVEKLPDRIGFSPEMVEAGIDTMVSIISRRGLETRLACDLGGWRYMDEWVYNPDFKGYMRAFPRGVVAHVSAGNVFVGAVDSLVQGLVTKNVNILKMSTVDPVFPVLFARSLKENDTTGVLHRALAVLHWRGGNEDVESVIKQRCDAIVVYGGAETVLSYRRGLGLHTKLIEYGPKYSFAVVSSKALEGSGLDRVAKLLAKDTVMWEQSACSSPHLVYVEGKENALSLMERIAHYLDWWAQRLPQGRVYDDEATEITKVRELAKVEKAMGTSDYRVSKVGLATVVYRDKREFEVSCLNRTLFVKAVDSLDEVVGHVSPMGNYLQSVALAMDEEDAKRLAETLAIAGADRFVEPGGMTSRKHGTPHDGTKGLSELVRWTSLSRERLEADWEVGHLWKRYDPDEDHFDFLGDEERDELTLRRIKNLLSYVKKHSSLLRERYEGIEVESFEDFKKLPLMTGEDYKKYVPPYGEGLLTSKEITGYVFSSGGTTGAPKVVYRTFEEQHFNAVRLGKGLRLSIFGPGDRVANLLFAGSMWASFVSFNQALEHTGCQILPISGNIDIRVIVELLRVFRPTGVITLPSIVVSIAEYVKAHGIDLKIKKVCTGGEHLFKEARRFISEVLGAERFASTGYTTNDTGAIGYQCPYCEGGVHHVHEDLHYMEILDEDGNPCPPGVAGRIVVTNLQRRLMPTIRYEVGDLGRWIEGVCPCGRKTRRFELLGRSDDVLIIGGANVYPEVVSESIGEVRGLSNHFQMIAETEGHKDRLTVVVEMLEGCKDDPGELADALKRVILSKSKEMRTMSEKGIIAGVEVKVVAPGSIPRNPRTGKIRLVEDRRV